MALPAAIHLHSKTGGIQSSKNRFKKNPITKRNEFTTPPPTNKQDSPPISVPVPAAPAPNGSKMRSPTHANSGFSIPEPGVVEIFETWRKTKPEAGLEQPVHHSGPPKLDRKTIQKLAEKINLKQIDISQVPVLVVAKDRPGMLKKCLDSLQEASLGKTMSITVHQHGTDSSVKQLVDKYSGISLVQDLRNLGKGEPHERIAAHYAFMLNYAFETSHKNARFAIIVEDDMVVSPDFFEYFKAVGGLFDVDSSVYCISTWNDNGFEDRVKDTKRLLRSEFFMGLGWMLSRKIFEDSWKNQWPKGHWDHWLRSKERKTGRECVYPEVSRNRNIGSKGEHVTDRFYREFLEKIRFTSHVDSENNKLFIADAVLGSKRAFETELELILSKANVTTPIHNVKKLHRNGVFAYSFAKSDGGKVEYPWETGRKSAWRKLSDLFGLWHERRTFRKGLVRFWWEGNYILLAEEGSKMHEKLVAMHGSLIRLNPNEAALSVPAKPLKKIVIAAQSQSCDQACSKHDSTCSKPHLSLLNSDCDKLKNYLGCKTCENNGGPDLPATVVEPQHEHFGKCLINTHAFTCGGTHKVTQRICPCV